MRLHDGIQLGDISSTQSGQHITANKYMHLDRMAGNYIRPNQDVFNHCETSKNWENGQIIPQLIAKGNQDISKVKIGRFMTRIGEYYLYHHSQLKNEFKTFFNGLRNKINGPKVIPEGTTSLPDMGANRREKRILNVIATAENQITTSFVAALFLIHQTQGIHHAWDPILRSGWESSRGIAQNIHQNLARKFIRDHGDHLIVLTLSQ
ncbi:uncharacterized protein MELLADRAFT_101008 [Melampsora larici-populina 98AG31]|uniref:Uncharacterized protein n=1 Tax=Melampsora larici-populina (strain 98AG31 / pathotype 3-4-7) TaxID=747676 RepID=F4R3B2_MELLP|nr:uncharacterized protein MELLADRAFT_101008 [Melampsora larici-populina 98AG31]EGG13199.1 hypothetical protein MELLADRAFT_101008 [Melampsora larici-populina 98AG31]